MHFYDKPVAQVIKILRSDVKSGLSSVAVEANLSRFGLNKLKEGKKKSLFFKFLAQFSDFMTIILILAAVVSFITAKIQGDSDYIDSIIILAIVALNSLMGVIQESKAEKAIESLQKLSSVKTQVLRNGQEVLIDSEYLTVGDIVYLNAGDYVPADARIISCQNLKVKEDALTGESKPVSKNADICLKENTPTAEQKNMVFMGSFITSGKAVCIVTHIGMQTHMGSIAQLINEETTPQTPLQRSLSKTGKYLGIGAIIICIAIFVLGLLQNINPVEMFMISISLAVAAIPEGLPAVVTIVLAIGIRRLASNRAIVRRLPAVETLGSADVICSDKTGTLTQNKMTVRVITDFRGNLRPQSEKAKHILSLATLCNDAKLTENQDGVFAIGDPTEIAIISATTENGIFKPDLDADFPRIAEKPFDSSVKMMTTVHKAPNGKYKVICKGAPDVLLNKCRKYFDGKNVLDLDTSTRKNIKKLNEDMAEKALRVLAVAYNDIDYIPHGENTEKNLIFVGLIAMIDPPRKEAKSAVAECKTAGIKPVMITGDHIDTAKAIATELNIYDSSRDKAITASELEHMSQKQLEETINDYSVFARVTPQHKVKIVKAFQKSGAVVAMTGDGVNDAPALKAADIGCAMGKGGTEVAKEASDMILTDDNFSTIVCAVKQGRAIFDNIRKTIHFLLSSNIGEIITVLSSFLLRLPSPLLAIQLLWVNLVTDSLPALALGVEPVEPDIMKRKLDKKTKGKLFTKQMAFEIAVEGSFIGAISMLAFSIGRGCFGVIENIDVGRTMAFCVLSLSQLVHAFNMRSEHSVFKIGLLSNKKMVISFLACVFLQVFVVSFAPITTIFKTVPLTPIQWLIVALLSISPLVIVEIEKALIATMDKKHKR